MKNKNLLKDRELHNCGIDSFEAKSLPLVPPCRSLFKNFDILSEFLSEEFSDSHFCKFSAIGFDFDDDDFIRQIQTFVDYDIFQVLCEAYHGSKYGGHFCILHHDLCGYHFLAF